MDTHRTKTNPQSQYCGTAPYSLHSRQRRQCTPTTRIVHRAYDASHFADPMRTCRPAPRSPRSSLRTHQKHARASTPTARLAPPTITARQCHGASHPKQHKHTSPAHPHDVPHSRNHCTLRNHHCTRTATRASHTARHTAPTTQHATENHTQSHTPPPRHAHRRAVRLPSVDGMLPETWLLSNLNSLHDTRSAITSHHGTRRRHRPQQLIA